MWKREGECAAAAAGGRIKVDTEVEEDCETPAWAPRMQRWGVRSAARQRGGVQECGPPDGWLCGEAREEENEEEQREAGEAKKWQCTIESHEVECFLPEGKCRTHHNQRESRRHTGCECPSGAHVGEHRAAVVGPLGTWAFPMSQGTTPGYPWCSRVATTHLRGTTPHLRSQPGDGQPPPPPRPLGCDAWSCTPGGILCTPRTGHSSAKAKAHWHAEGEGESVQQAEGVKVAATTRSHTSARLRQVQSRGDGKEPAAHSHGGKTQCTWEMPEK